MVHALKERGAQFTQPARVRDRLALNLAPAAPVPPLAAHYRDSATRLSLPSTKTFPFGENFRNLDDTS